MYDRKTWIVVIACSILLATNIYFQNKNKVLVEQDNKARAAAEESAKKAADAAKGQAPGPDGQPAPVPGLVEAPPPVEVVEQTVTLETSEAKFVFTSIGGGMKYSELKNQTPGVEGPVQLNRHGSNAVGALSEGSDRVEGGNYEYVSASSQPGKSVVFRGKLPSGLVAEKTWSLRETGNEGDPFMLDFKVELKNDSGNSVNLDNYSVFLGSATPLDNVERGDQTGYVVNDGDSFTFHSSTEFAKGWFRPAKDQITTPLDKTIYAGVSNQFFTTVLKPTEQAGSVVWSAIEERTLVQGARPVKAIRAGLSLPKATLAPAEKRTLTFEVFTGPKQNRILRKMETKWGSEWGSLMNYTPKFVSPFSRFLNWSLWWVHSAITKITTKWTWGIAVVVLTILLRTAIWPLYNRSNRTMKRMSKLKPEMDKLREKYPDDPQKMNQEMMGLYRKYGINPVGGCLPMFAQIPIFLGFYSMLLHAVEMRGQGFLWVMDLSQPDTVFHIGGIPINPLPILMAISSFAQMAMMPNTGGDKTQMAVMKFMPFMFLFICYNFASALALYWTTSNLFSIGQTWLSNRLPEPELKAKAGAGGKSMMQRLAEKAEEAQKMKQAKGREITPDDDEPKKRSPRTGG
ncbi:membrane protein insertase YidC [Haloferula sp. BvORR071]|uniref:membrane protein insertase YidC n=1 Tax=Haloferula sp. BvORR071 TaxID=1396141 RepID=UPI000558BAEB|nr:membrane protein insertase YidC [Haloferula sp. BvORR071]